MPQAIAAAIPIRENNRHIIDHWFSGPLSSASSGGSGTKSALVRKS
jgi:hypothetical protein